MPGFKIFIPGRQSYRDHCAEVGLGMMTTDQGPLWENEAQGPSGGPGMLGCWEVADPALNPPRGMPPDFKWAPAPPDPETGVEKGAYWVGYNPHDPPGPVHFERRKQLQGFNVKLGDGREWKIPSAIAIPKHYGIDPDTGEKCVEIDPKYDRFCKTAFVYAQEFYSRGEDIKLLAQLFGGVTLTEEQKAYLEAKAGEWTGNPETTLETLQMADIEYRIAFDDCVDHAFLALELNYRIPPTFISTLKLLNPETLRQLVFATIDMQEIGRHLKKKEPELEISLPVGFPI